MNAKILPQRLLRTVTTGAWIFFLCVRWVPCAVAAINGGQDTSLYDAHGEYGNTSVVKPVKVEDVWVVFKTHFDIGYTASIAEVLARYRGPMIDNALAVIEANQALPREQRFTWTVPGWPLYYILGPDQTPERRARIVQALKAGALAVHAAPFTLHTESFDLEDLVRGLHYSAQIARDNGLPLPRSAKMTDVPRARLDHANAPQKCRC